MSSSITKVYEVLKECYTFIDYRCAYFKEDNQWISIVSIFRFTNKEYEELNEYHDRLRRLSHNTDWFKVEFEILKVEEWKTKWEKIKEDADFQKEGFDLDSLELYRNMEYNSHSPITQVDRDYNTIQFNVNSYEYKEHHKRLEYLKEKKELRSIGITSIYPIIRQTLQIQFDRKSQMFSFFLFPIYFKIKNVSYTSSNLSGEIEYHKIFHKSNLIIKHYSRGSEQGIIENYLIEDKMDPNQNYYTTQFKIFIDIELHKIEDNISQFVLNLYFSSLNLELTDFKQYAYKPELAHEEKIPDKETIRIETVSKNQSLFIKSNFKDYYLSEYEEFIELINNSAYDDKYYRILPILLRCLLENLLYDIFQTGLDKKNTEFFFLKSQSRARDFSQLIALLNILKDKDFKPYHKDSLNQSIIDVLKDIQMFGNWTVHQILRQVDKNFADDWEQKVNRVLSALLVFYKKIKSETLEITDWDTLDKINKTLNLEKPEDQKDDTLKPKIIKWKVIIQDEDRPIDVENVLNSLLPDKPDGDILKLKCTIEKSKWRNLQEYLENEMNALFNEQEYNRFAIFSLANISSAIYLGYLLTSRVKIKYTHYNRDLQTWKWFEDIKQVKLQEIKVYGMPDDINQNLNEIIVKISLTAKILDDQIGGLGFNLENKIEIAVNNPSEDWLKLESQIADLSRSFRDILTNLRKNAPNLSKIHLFYAGPTAGAIAIGRQINLKMGPIVQLYEFNRNRRPNYQKSILIGDN